MHEDYSALTSALSQHALALANQQIDRILCNYMSALREEVVLLEVKSKCWFEGVKGMKDAQHHSSSNMGLLLSVSMLIES